MATAAAMLAVIVVPIFSPSTIAAAMSNPIHPLDTNTIVRAIVALEAWSTIVRIVPIARKMRTEPNPYPVMFCTNARASGCSSRFGTDALRAARPRISRENPMMHWPMLLLRLFLLVEKINPRATNGMATVEISTLNPNTAMSQAVTVVPILAPIMTPIAFPSERSPAFTMLTTITVVPLEDWMRAVMMIPVMTLLNLVDVMAARNDLSLSPAAF